jgi:citronellol/citronellal dehydrogenase
VSLKNKTVLISGASRGIGEAIAIRLAGDGANVALVAKTAEPHPKLPGTVFTAAEAVKEAGGRALPLVGDIRDDEFVKSAMAKTAEKFGGIDIVVNNASAIDMSATTDVTMKKYDLMNDINSRGTFSVSKHAIPYLKESAGGHILTVSPPLSLDPKWFQDCTAYSISKYGMSLVTLGLSEELRKYGIAVNSIWPRTAIDTAAVRNLFLDGSGDDNFLARTRKPSIMADAAYQILTTTDSELTGRFLIDDEVVRAAGVTDLSVYANGPDVATNPVMSFWSEPADPR